MCNQYSILLFYLLFSLPLRAELPVDSIPKSLTLPAQYPESWLFVHDLNYSSAVFGKYIILDVAASSHQHKGQFQGAQLASFAESKRRSELYVAETFYARGGRGKRTDVLTIYEKTNLKSIAEVILPGEKRALMAPHKGVMQITQDEQFVLIFNFTPAASVTVVDLDKRSVLNEVPIPGCSLIYPSGQRGFSTLCSNGTLISFALDRKGQVSMEHLSRPFNDIDKDVLYMTPTTIDGVSYFPTASGRIQPVNLAKDKPDIQPSWSLITLQEAADAWRTVDGQSIASDSWGRLFVRMHRIAADGSHQADTSEVWVFDVTTQQRLLRIALKNDGGSIEVTRGKKPYLVLTSAKGFDVYDAITGEFIRNIGGWWPGTSHSLMFASK